MSKTISFRPIYLPHNKGLGNALSKRSIASMSIIIAARKSASDCRQSVCGTFVPHPFFFDFYYAAENDTEKGLFSPLITPLFCSIFASFLRFRHT